MAGWLSPEERKAWFLKGLPRQKRERSKVCRQKSVEFSGFPVIADRPRVQSEERDIVRELSSYFGVPPPQIWILL